MHSQVAYSEATRDFILSVLHSTATKREAKQYMSKYSPRLVGTSNLDGSTSKAPLRLSIIKIRDIDSVSDASLYNVANMVQQLAKLGASPIFVLDADKERSAFVTSHLSLQDGTGNSFKNYRDRILQKAQRLVEAIDATGGKQSRTGPEILAPQNDGVGALKARPIHGIFEVVNKASIGNLQPVLLNTIMQPLGRNVTPILLPIAYDGLSGDEKLVNADKLILSLVTALMESAKVSNDNIPPLSIEKVVYIDPLGGTPSTERGGSHFLVNFDQEFESIRSDLLSDINSDAKIHLQNLQSMHSILSILPGEASGIITSPGAAGYTTSKNPIIYNMLTDRPIVSASLPVAMKRTPVLQTTILRKGMPIKCLYSEEGLDLVKEDKIGTVDLMELTALIDNSFGKSLDLKHYLNRVNGKVAGLIIAGDYEGAAIITWEQAKGSDKRVAYLDKFAVRTTSQGSSGVADMLFKEMVSQMFPKEVLWRSRRNNPVNKWYFERSKGTMKVPDSNWTMFWTGTETRENMILSDYLEICSAIEPSLRAHA